MYVYVLYNGKLWNLECVFENIVDNFKNYVYNFFLEVEKRSI